MRQGAALSILVAMLAYCAAATFLEYYGPRVGPKRVPPTCMSRRGAIQRAALQVLGGALIVFGAPSLIAALGIAILAGRLGPGPAGRWGRRVGNVNPWFSPRVDRDRGTGWGVGVGFWVGLAAAVVAVLGAIVLLVGRDGRADALVAEE